MMKPLLRYGIILTWLLLFLAFAVEAAPPQISGCQIFPANNVWNTPVDSLPVHSDSTAWVNTIGATASLHPDYGTFYLGSPIGIPFVTVAATQPAVPITFAVPGESDPGPYPIPPNAPIEGGSSASGDRHVLVLENTNCILYEMFSSFPQTGGAWTAYSGAKFNLGSNASRPDTWTSADAAGIAILPGLVRYDEVVAGEINHALRFTAPQTRNAHVWPARHDASSLTGAQYPPMGARFRLKAGFDITTYAPQNQVVLRALKKYGMILADNGSSWYISGEHNPLWDDDLLSGLKTPKGSDFEAVDSASLIVNANTAQAFAPPPTVALREVANGLSNPLGITHAGDGSGRLFIVEKGGLIKILKNGAVLATPFLNVSALISTSGERGLLGLAFHPQFSTNRRFFIFYTRVTDGAIRVSSFVASSTNPDLADAASEQEIITIPHPGFDNHNGGHIAFGPDGYLYIGVGDGGGGGDTANNSQTLSTRLGKLLRIDINTPSAYLIPPANPFVATSGAMPEIWAYGLRNPWRFSFDRLTGDLYIGDVGQGTTEEVDFQSAGSVGGQNYGWRVFEGTNCYNPPTGCSLANHTPPVLQYGHNSTGGFSITGGYVYRGSKSLALRGYYIYGDFVSNRVWAAQHDGSVWTTFVLIAPPSLLSGISSFGEDEAGEIYVANYYDGRIYAIDGPAPGAAPPGAPTNVSFTIGNAQATLTFSAPASDGGSAITGYTATCTAAGQITRTNSAAASPITVSGLTGGVLYSCTVTAQNSIGSSTPSTPVTVTPLAAIDIIPILMMLLFD